MKTKLLSATAAVAASFAIAAPAFAQDTAGAEPYIGASVGHHDAGVGIPNDDGLIYGAVAGVDFPVGDTFFVGAEGNYHLGDGAIDKEYGIAARAGVKVGGSKLYVKGGYQEVDFDLGELLGAPVPAGIDDTDGDYIVGVGADIGLGATSPVSLRLAADTIAFDSTRLTAGVLFKF